MSTHDEPVDLLVDGQHVSATLVTPGTVVPGVLFVHGWGGNQEQYLGRAREVAALGCVCLTVDLRGHGKADGHRDEVTREDNLRDVLAAYDRLVAQRIVDRDSLAVVGSSYGAYLAALLTTQRPVRWLGLRVPALYPDEEWEVPKQKLDKTMLHAYRRKTVASQDNRALRACAAFAGDVLIVESERDDLVPHTVIENYIEACKHARSLTYRVIEGADHGLTELPAQRAYTSLLVNWLTEMVFGARTAGTVASGSARQGSAPVDSRPGARQLQQP